MVHQSAWQAPTHFFSQLVYLNTVPAMGVGRRVHVGDLAGYYLNNPVGKQYLSARFNSASREYPLWLDFLERSAAPYRDWLITDILDDNAPDQTGFYSCTYLGPMGERIVAFRGSELLGNRRYQNDYRADLALAYTTVTPQQVMVDKYWRKFGESGSGSLAVTGHSLGGNLAVHGALCAPPAIRRRIASCHAYNAPGFCREYIREHREDIGALGERIALYQNKYDPVSSMLDNVREPVVVRSLFIPSEQEDTGVAELFYPHSNFMYETDESGLLRPEEKNEKCGFCRAAGALADLFQLLPAAIRRDLAELVLKALYSAPSGKNDVRYAVEATLEYISRGEGIGAAAVLYGAELLYRSRTGSHIGSVSRCLSENGGPCGTRELSQVLVVLLEMYRYAKGLMPDTSGAYGNG